MNAMASITQTVQAANMKVAQNNVKEHIVPMQLIFSHFKATSLNRRPHIRAVLFDL